MSYEVEVEIDNPGRDHERLDKEFRNIHNTKFLQYCNIDAYTEIGEWHTCDHGINIYPASDILDRTLLAIPCHWDYHHMVQTEKDIRIAANNLGIIIKTRLSY